MKTQSRVLTGAFNVTLIFLYSDIGFSTSLAGLRLERDSDNACR